MFKNGSFHVSCLGLGRKGLSLCLLQFFSLVKKLQEPLQPLWKQESIHRFTGLPYFTHMSSLDQKLSFSSGFLITHRYHSNGGSPDPWLPAIFSTQPPGAGEECEQFSLAGRAPFLDEAMELCPVNQHGYRKWIYIYIYIYGWFCGIAGPFSLMIYLSRWWFSMAMLVHQR